MSLSLCLCSIQPIAAPVNIRMSEQLDRAAAHTCKDMCETASLACRIAKERRVGLSLARIHSMVMGD